jgi:hypothetical protein
MPTATYLKRNPVQVIEQGATTLYARVAIGASGAATTTGYGFTSIAKSTTGEYLITLDRKYKKLLALNVTVQQATDQGLITSIKTNSLTSAGTILIRTAVGATETEPSSGSILYIELTVGDTGMSGGVA